MLLLQVKISLKSCKWKSGWNLARSLFLARAVTRLREFEYNGNFLKPEGYVTIRLWQVNLIFSVFILKYDFEWIHDRAVRDNQILQFLNISNAHEFKMYVIVESDQAQINKVFTYEK